MDINQVLAIAIDRAQREGRQPVGLLVGFREYGALVQTVPDPPQVHQWRGYVVRMSGEYSGVKVV